MRPEKTSLTGFLKSFFAWLGILLPPIATIIQYFSGNTDSLIFIVSILSTILSLLILFYVTFSRDIPVRNIGFIGNKDSIKTEIMKRWKYPRGRKYTIPAIIVILLVGLCIGGYLICHKLCSTDKVIVLVSSIDGPKQNNYRVTENVLSRLHIATNQFKDMEVEFLDETISEKEGSVVAREKGMQQKASIVIWGWYGVSREMVKLSVYLEFLLELRHMHNRRMLDWTRAIKLLDSYKIQEDLSRVISFVTLSTVGMARYAADDYDGSVEYITKALEYSQGKELFLEKGTLYFYRANSFQTKGDYDLAISDYDHALELVPNMAEALNNRGLAYANKGNHKRCINDLNKAIQLKPDYSVAYYNRAISYDELCNIGKAIDDLNKSIIINPNYAEAYSNRALAFIENGNYKKALNDCQKAMLLSVSTNIIS
ncbi:MAG TPA: tetratricopeptide repeat protein [Myxococcota bacterium]|nr:tetratricopeptide repeat protein [Myxococcota bacterium]